MKYCKHCGSACDDTAVVCPGCGNPFDVDSGHVGWGILGFLIPIVGLILYFAWKGPKPKNARMAIIGALIGFLCVVLLEVIVMSNLFALF